MASSTTVVPRSPYLGLQLLSRQNTITTRFLISRQKLRYYHPPTTTIKTNFTHFNNTHKITPCSNSLQQSRTRDSSLYSPPSLRFFVFQQQQYRAPSLRSLLTSMSTPQASSNPPQQSSSSKTVRFVIKGRVQGVFYRNWTVENATQLGLKGWVRNRRDGTVEALFSGDSDKVQEMEQRCRRGPPDAMVTGLQVFPCDDDPGTGFKQKPTV